MALTKMNVIEKTSNGRINLMGSVSNGKINLIERSNDRKHILNSSSNGKMHLMENSSNDKNHQIEILSNDKRNLMKNSSNDKQNIIERSSNGKNLSLKLPQTTQKSKKPGMIKTSKSLIDVSLFGSKKKKVASADANFAASLWNVSPKNRRSDYSSESSTGKFYPPIQENDVPTKITFSISSTSDDQSVSKISSVDYYESARNNPSVVSSTIDGSKSDDCNALKSVSRSTPTMNNQRSLERKDTLPHLPKSTKKFHKHFSEVAKVEKVLNYYVCAYVSDILHQGTLYITEKYFAFYSNIFGYVNKILIPISEVTAIKKKKTASFIPNAIGIQTDEGKMHVFSSLISRENTYKFMEHMWKKSRKILDSDSDPAIVVQPDVEEESHLEDSVSGESNLEDDSISVTPSLRFPELRKHLGENLANKIGNDKFGRNNFVLNDVRLPSKMEPFSFLDILKIPIQFLKNELATTFILWSSVIAVFVLFISASYLMYRVEILTRQIDGDDPIDYNNVYEEVLHMQQKLHSGSSEQVEKTLGTQLKQIAMIRQSLEALSYLFNQDFSSREKLPENAP